MMQEDNIQIQGLTVSASVGVSATERAHPQNLLIDIEMEPQNSFDSLQDDISLTADYEKATQKIRSLCTTVSYRLIETLASEIVQLLFIEFPVKQVTVRIRKFILPDTEYVAVQMTRERSH